MSQSKKKIFLADDSITIQKVVELTFSEGNYEVICVGNGAAAMQRLAEVSPDIALLDVIMPERSGYDVCAHIRKDKDLGWMPVLLLTGAFEPYDEKRAGEAGADGHMTKPFESRALVTTVEALLASRPRPGQSAAQSAVQSGPPAGRPQEYPAAAPPTQAAHTVRMKATDLFTEVPPGPAARPASAAPPAAASTAGASMAASPRPAASTAPQRTPPSTAQAAAASSASRPSTEQPAPTGANGGARAVSVPPEMLERAVREVVAGISEKIVREVAWEVIPDLAEAIIQRRIRELEEEAGH